MENNLPGEIPQTSFFAKNKSIVIPVINPVTPKQ